MFGPCHTDGNCCGAGSYCCKNNAPHTHTLDEVYGQPTGQRFVLARVILAEDIWREDSPHPMVALPAPPEVEYGSAYHFVWNGMDYWTRP